jgi:hypothetical protein
MQRFSAWARWIFTIILIGVVLPFAVHFIEQQPRETTDVVSEFLLDLSEQPWLPNTALFLGGLVIGLWLDWLLRILDGSRAEQREALGDEMLILNYNLGNLKDPMSEARVEIMSWFITARKFRIWAPDQRVFNLEPGRAYGMIRDYLMSVGTMLRDGHFAEAKRRANKGKASFAREHGLST